MIKQKGPQENCILSPLLPSIVFANYPNYTLDFFNQEHIINVLYIDPSQENEKNSTKTNKKNIYNKGN